MSAGPKVRLASRTSTSSGRLCSSSGWSALASEATLHIVRASRRTSSSSCRPARSMKFKIVPTWSADSTGQRCSNTEQKPWQAFCTSSGSELAASHPQLTKKRPCSASAAGHFSRRKAPLIGNLSSRSDACFRSQPGSLTSVSSMTVGSSFSQATWMKDSSMP